MLCKKCGKLVEPQYEQIGECENCFAEAQTYTYGNEIGTYEDRPKPDIISENEILELPISDSDLTESTENRLSDKGIIYIRDLVIKTETELRKIPNWGDKTLAEIKEQLQKFNLALKEDPSQLLTL